MLPGGRRTSKLRYSDRLICIRTNTWLHGRIEDVVEQGAFLIDLQRVHAPVRLVESCRVVLNVGFAGAGFAGAGTRWPDCAGPVTAEGYVEDLAVSAS